MSITHVTDRERELLARIELLRAALASIKELANSPKYEWSAYDVYVLADSALRVNSISDFYSQVADVFRDLNRVNK